MGYSHKFNDAFGFFLSGPNIAGEFSHNSINIARLPFSEDYISLKTLHCGRQIVFKSPPPMDGPNCNFLIWNNKFKDHPFGKCYIAYDEYTIPLTAKQEIIPGEIYHIKIAISDIRTSNWDSGVFLEAGSFDIGLLHSELLDEKDFTDNLIHQCNKATYKIYLQNQATEDLNIPLTYHGNIIQGEDINTLPDEVHILAGLQETTFEIEALKDHFGDEHKFLVIKRPISPYSTDQFEYDTLWLQNYEPINITNFPENLDLDCDEEHLFSPEISQGIAPYHFLWQWQGNSSSEESYALSTNTPEELSLNISDQCKREVSAICDIAVNGAYLELPEDMEACLGKTISLHAETSTTDILWNTGATTADIQVTIVSDTIIWCQIEACGESIKKEIAIYVIRPHCDLGKDTLICPRNIVLLDGGSGESYLWNTGETTVHISVSPLFATLYYLDLTDVCGNTKRDSIWVNVDTESFAFAGNDTTVCDGQTLYFYAEGGESIEWISGGSVLSTQRQIKVKPSKDMQIILKTHAYCTAMDTLNITWHETPKFSLDITQEKACAPLEICWKPEYDGNFTWQWTANDQIIAQTSELEKSFSDAGIYQIKLKASTTHCADSLMLNDILEVYENPIAHIGSDNLEEYLCGQAYDFTTQNPNPLWNYLWKTSEGSDLEGEIIAYTFQQVGEQWVILQVNTEHNCTAADTLYIKTTILGPDLIVPNAFSPNGDGINDEFEVISNQLQEYHLQIYNRWGERIFQSKDPTEHWKGNPGIASEVYVVKITYRSKDGNQKIYMGMVIQV